MQIKPYHIEPTPAAQSSASDFIHDSYVMHIHPQHCTFCNRRSARSTLYEVHIHRTRIGLSGLRRLTLARSLKPGFTLATIRFPSEDTPTCHACVEYLPLTNAVQSVERQRSEHEWAHTLKRKAAPAPSSEGVQAPAPTPRKHIPSASDL